MNEMPAAVHEKPKYSGKQRANRIMQYARDIALIVVGVLLMSTSYPVFLGQKEAAHFILFGIAAVLALFSLTNLILLIAKIKRKGYFYFNAIFQLPVGFVLAGLLAPVGIPVMALNIAILATMRDKKPK